MSHLTQPGSVKGCTLSQSVAAMLISVGILIHLCAVFGSCREDSTDRRASKVLNMFQLTRFPNDACEVSGTTVRGGREGGREGGRVGGPGDFSD